ncbi:MAG: hypothetical protein EBZ69_09255, partial [Alphaproteobacteria bacterium]|nr:hypothetical protein [Alphaproteobacteria bacterium]
MMESLYVYGGIERGSYGFEKYLAKYQDLLGKKMFDKVYEEELEKLQEYEVEKNVYTDSEGLSYNTLKRKYARGGKTGKKKITRQYPNYSKEADSGLVAKPQGYRF